MDVLHAIDQMPKERGSDFLAGVVAGWANGRTYTRVDGNRFQVSRSAGMGTFTVISGDVSEEFSRTFITIFTTYGLVPVLTWLVTGICLSIGALALLFFGYFFYSLNVFLLSVAAFIWFFFKRSDAKYLRSEVSKRLGGLRWKPLQD